MFPEYSLNVQAATLFEALVAAETPEFSINVPFMFPEFSLMGPLGSSRVLDALDSHIFCHFLSYFPGACYPQLTGRHFDDWGRSG
jgi:hypothetical protein